MARLLSNIALKGIVRSSAHSFKFMVVSESVSRHGLDYSTRISADSDTHEDFLPTQKSASPSVPTRISSNSDTHEDFRPTNHPETLNISVQDVVMQDVSRNPVMLYMKGLPDAPRCGFSALAVKVLQQYGVPIGARDILEDHKLKEAVKNYSNWPTFPQIFIKGEFVGGSDIVLSMHQKGELKELLGDTAPHGKEEEA